LSDDTQRSAEGKSGCSSYEIDNVEMIDGTKEDSVEQSDWEDDELKEDQIRMDNEESCTAEKVQKKKKVKRRRMCDRRSDERTCLRSYNVNINSLKRTHYQSGKRARGRNRPSLI